MLGVEETAGEVVDAAIGVHRRWGPGLLESAYSQILGYELDKRGILVERQVHLDLVHEKLIVRGVYCADMIVNGNLVVELKASESVHPVHFRQLLTYLKITNLRVGLLINFGQPTLKDGLRRVVNG